MRILVTGSRNWEDEEVLAFALGEALGEFVKAGAKSSEIVLVSGACPTGADRMAESLWEARGLRVERHPADWAQYGRAAGPIRNQEMVDLGADLCLAFLMPGSRGTADCVRRAEKAGIPVRKFESVSVVDERL